MNAKGVCMETFSQVEKYKKTQPHMKPSMKIETCMSLIQEFSLNEWPELKFVISLKQNSYSLWLTNTFHGKPAGQRFGECLQPLWSHEVQVSIVMKN